MKNTCQQEYKYRDLFFYMAITALAIYTIAAVANTTIIFACCQTNHGISTMKCVNMV